VSYFLFPYALRPRALKPAEETPLTALRLGALALEAGIPKGVLNVVTGLGPSLDPSAEQGPLVSAVQRQRVMKYIGEGMKDGARVVAGGKTIDSSGYYVQPTVFADVTDTMSIVREEIFGPVIVVKPFDDLNEVAKVANDTVYGLGASIWTRDVRKIFSLAPKLRVGTVWVNCHSVADPSMPFGGYKQSGWGKERGRDSVYAYLESKSLCINFAG
jgi:phenylacetaldehyde dehydrogenase